MKASDALDDRETEACSGDTAARRVAAGEGPLQVLHLIRRDTLSAVGDLEHDRAIGDAGGDLDRRRPVTQRIVDQVAHQPFECGGSQRHLRQLAAGEAHVAAGAPVTCNHRGDDVSGVAHLRLRFVPVASEVEELTDDPVHLLDIVDHALMRVIVRCADLDAEAQSRQRRAQVVRYPGKQNRAVLLDLTQVGQHLVEAAVEVDDLRRAALRQRRR